MHDIEPYYKWRDYYVASEDKISPFYGRTYNEFQFTQKIYNYFIHPQWDYIGSPTIYIKILFVEYTKGYSIIELIGEWNDAVHNDIMYLKREIIDHMTKVGISRFILLCDHVLNFHGDEDCYYEEWYDDIKDEDGWVCLINLRQHIYEEMSELRLHNYVHLRDEMEDIEWRNRRPGAFYKLIADQID